MIGTGICLPFFLFARAVHEAGVYVAKIATTGNLIYEIFAWAYRPFMTESMPALVVVGVIYTLLPIFLGKLPEPLGLFLRRVSLAYTWVGLGIYVALGILAAVLS